MKRIILLIVGALLFFTAGCAAADTTPDPEADPEPDTDPVTYDPIPEIINATITMEDGGVIELALYPGIAPQAVLNFISLAREGFYDGLSFHRIIKGFMIQGGCPSGTGTGNPGYSIKGEFSDNGFENNLKHTRGVLSMARSPSGYDTAGSQFFIVHSDYPSLNGSYAAFGKVTDGMDVVDKIAETPNSGGVTEVKDRPVIKSITINSDLRLPEPDKIKR